MSYFETSLRGDIQGYDLPKSTNRPNQYTKKKKFQVTNEMLVNMSKQELFDAIDKFNRENN